MFTFAEVGMRKFSYSYSSDCSIQDFAFNTGTNQAI